jgi:2-polyprenyl-6-methoxyphenol hydroxylase-like FAD-dependent oxidoreductase
VERVDVVIVGGGIAGGATATALARAGVSVVVLERQVEYADHVRGEIMWQWGVPDARLLGVEDVLLEAGALVVDRLDTYDEGEDSPAREPLGETVLAVPGSLNISHPAACAALARAAESAGARMLHGVREVRVAAGRAPAVSWLAGGDETHMRCRLVLGADGRRSVVRAQAGLEAEVDPPAHWIAGLLVSGIDTSVAGVNLIAREGDLLLLSFPQQGERARVYLCFPLASRGRFAGEGGAARFLEACRLECVADARPWDRATAAGPCATFPGEDSRVPVPCTEGVILVGDAAGYQNPLQGLGLSMAMRDAREVVEAALSSASWSLDAISSYVASRAHRQRWAALSNALEIWANHGFSRQDAAERAARYAHIRADELLAALESTPFAGFDAMPADVTSADVTARLRI